MSGIFNKKNSYPGAVAAVIALLVVVLIVYMLIDYMNQQKAQSTLHRQIAETGSALELIPEPESGLSEKLDELKAESAARHAASGRRSSTEMIRSVLGIAGECGVKTGNLKTSQWSEKTFDDKQFSVMPVEISLEGELSGLITLLQILEDGQEFNQLAVTGLNISTGSGEFLQDFLRNSTEIVQSKLTFVVFEKIDDDTENEDPGV